MQSCRPCHSGSAAQMRERWAQMSPGQVNCLTRFFYLSQCRKNHEEQKATWIRFREEGSRMGRSESTSSRSKDRQSWGLATPTVPRRGASWPREHGNSVLAQCRVGGIVWPSKDALRLCAGALHLGCNSPAMVPSGEMLPARPMGVEGTVGATMASSCAKRSGNNCAIDVLARTAPVAESPTTVARNLWLFCFQFGWLLWIGASRPFLNCASSFSSSVGLADARIGMTEACVPTLGDTRTFSDVIACLHEEAYLRIAYWVVRRMSRTFRDREITGQTSDCTCLDGALFFHYLSARQRRGLLDLMLLNMRRSENRGYYPSGQPVKLINDAQPLGIPHSQAETRSVSEKIKAKEDVDPPGEIQSRSIGCIDTQGACGPKNFQREKRKEGTFARGYDRTASYVGGKQARGRMVRAIRNESREEKDGPVKAAGRQNPKDRDIQIRKRENGNCDDGLRRKILSTRRHRIEAQ
ncbi:hypothetical protein EDB86DRAFT_3244453 [Lactarius hatsudake]|nr:hypothetical protein EDB86DRAFT_3244453 [Lactarius hatsudake]